MRVRYARTPNLYPRQNGPFWEHCFREEDVRPELARANAEIDRLHKRLWEARKRAVIGDLRILSSETWRRIDELDMDSDVERMPYIRREVKLRKRLAIVTRMEYKP